MPSGVSVTESEAKQGNGGHLWRHTGFLSYERGPFIQWHPFFAFYMCYICAAPFIEFLMHSSLQNADKTNDALS